jgi:hypothetical protein
MNPPIIILIILGLFIALTLLTILFDSKKEFDEEINNLLINYTNCYLDLLRTGKIGAWNLAKYQVSEYFLECFYANSYCGKYINQFHQELGELFKINPNKYALYFTDAKLVRLMEFVNQDLLHTRTFLNGIRIYFYKLYFQP